MDPAGFKTPKITLAAAPGPLENGHASHIILIVTDHRGIPLKRIQGRSELVAEAGSISPPPHSDPPRIPGRDRATSASAGTAPVVTASLYALPSSGEARRKAPALERAIRRRRRGGLRASLRPLRVTVGRGGREGGVFAFLGSRLMRFSGCRTSPMKGRRRAGEGRHRETPGRAAPESSGQ